MPFIAFIDPPSVGPGPGLTVFTIFFGERIGSTAAPSGAPLAARQEFDSYLPLEDFGGVNPAVETWEGKSLGAGLDSTSSTHSGYPVSGTALVSWTADTSGGNFDNGDKIGFYDSPFGGRYNTTAGGAWYLECALPLILQPEDPFDNFGLYLTDIGDFGSQMRIELRDTDGVTTTYTLAHASNAGNTLHFWGFIDPTGKKYNRVRILPTGTPDGGGTRFEDFFGIDDVVLGRAFD